MARIAKTKTRKTARTKHYYKPRPAEFSDYCSSPLVKKIVIGVIFAVFLVTGIYVVYHFYLTNENVTKYRLSELASDYYENYFYEELTNSEAFKQNGSLETVMENYNKYGLPRIALKDLIVHGEQKTTPYAGYLTNRCDENDTFVKFYPDPPYEKTSYHFEYTYACNFD